MRNKKNETNTLVDDLEDFKNELKNTKKKRNKMTSGDIELKQKIDNDTLQYSAQHRVLYKRQTSLFTGKSLLRLC